MVLLNFQWVYKSVLDWVFIFIIVDIDECAIKQPCNSQNAICKNTVGSYKCVCKTGFTGDGINCQKGIMII